MPILWLLVSWFAGSVLTAALFSVVISYGKHRERRAGRQRIRGSSLARMHGHGQYEAYGLYRRDAQAADTDREEADQRARG
jgi:hypothetical protein